jgi:hypothetical protein
MMALRKDRGKRIQDCGRFAELLGECIGAARARGEGRQPNPDSPLRRSMHTTGPIAAIDVATPATGVAPPIPMQALNTKSKLVIGGLALGFVIVVGAMFFSSGKSDGDTDENTPAATTKPDDGTKPPIDVADLPKNRAMIDSNVDGARVFLDGELECETPCQVEIPVGDGAIHELVLRKDGYVEVMTKWQPRSVTDRPPQLPDLKPATVEIELK